ncbi:hypothetical protein BFF78_05155 [Streptomyces fodineus]|uniref:DNA methylase adenine-specific domain-containing protein n=1 Tax=Streptomyces fodineus TaxID=1904616 RepID=A0A1D7Y4K0_9ACTN|nr:hypothetical protein BFF78_05155 [Streptomyces fodineus]
MRSFEHIARHLPPGVPPAQREQPAHGAIRGTELVDATARLATMNLFLHGVERLDGNRTAIEVRDSLAVSPRRRATLVLTDPPMGQRRSVTSSTGASGLRGTGQTSPPRVCRSSTRRLDLAVGIAVLGGDFDSEAAKAVGGVAAGASPHVSRP